MTEISVGVDVSGMVAGEMLVGGTVLIVGVGGGVVVCPSVQAVKERSTSKVSNRLIFISYRSNPLILHQ